MSKPALKKCRGDIHPNDEDAGCVEQEAWQLQGPRMLEKSIQHHNGRWHVSHFPWGREREHHR